MVLFELILKIEMQNIFESDIFFENIFLLIENAFSRVIFTIHIYPWKKVFSGNKIIKII